MWNHTSDTWAGAYQKSHDWLLCTNYLEGLGVGARREMITEQLKRDLFLFSLLPCHVQMSFGFLSACLWLRILLRWHLVWRAKCCACISAGNFAVDSREDHLHFTGTRLSIVLKICNNCHNYNKVKFSGENVIDEMLFFVSLICALTLRFSLTLQFLLNTYKKNILMIFNNQEGKHSI